MNYYERIQKSIDYIENTLKENIKVEDVAKEAFMSLSNFHRMFFAIVGYSAKEYIRLRRISLAASEIKTNKSRLIDIAVKYAYDSTDAFSRAFKNVTGLLPSKYCDSEKDYIFERMNLMDKYFEIQDKELLEKYPDIKVLKEIPPMRVAYYCYYGKNPEDGAFHVMSNWILKNNINLKDSKYRIFGYNAPDSNLNSIEYGYEVCLTIPDEMNINDDNIKIKTLEGGLYVVTAIEAGECLGENIMKGWQRFQQWIQGSKYAYGARQWLEEHLGFSENAEHIGGVDLYMPIMLKSEMNIEETEIYVDSMKTVSYTATGKNAENKARKYIFNWAMKNNINFDNENCHIFAFYNFKSIGKLDFFYTLYISIDGNQKVDDQQLKVENYNGGLYLKRNIKYKNNAESWFDFISSIEKSRKYTYGNYQFMEEYIINKPIINGETEVIQYMPVTRK